MENIKILSVAVILVLAFGVIYMVAENSGAQVVAVGDVVNVSYTGTFTNGTVFDSNVGQQPLQFTVGSGQVINGFDQAVLGMRVGEEKKVTIPANDAYGEINPALIVTVPISSFGNQTVEKGMGVSEVSGGQHINGVVTEVNSSNATIDFNPPLAGQTLIFNITILSIGK